MISSYSQLNNFHRQTTVIEVYTDAVIINPCLVSDGKLCLKVKIRSSRAQAKIFL